MATLTNIQLKVDRKFCRIYNGIIYCDSSIHQQSCHFLLHMIFSRAMAALTTDARLHFVELILRPQNKIRITVVARHTFQSDNSAEPGIMSVFKTWRQMPFSFLDIKSCRCLIQITIGADNMRIGMLTGTNNVIDGYILMVNCIFPMQTIFKQMQ